MSIYSTRFFAGSYSTAGLTAVYTVPTAYVAIIRTVTFHAASTSAEAALVLNGAEGFAGGGLLPNDGNVWQNGRVVLNAGDMIGVYVFSGTTQITCSGYLLAD